MGRRDDNPPIVVLTEVDEFLAEVDRDREKIDRQLVRCTKVARPSRSVMQVTMVHVEAGYRVDGEIIRLRSYCGDLFDLPSHDEEVQARATATIRQIEEHVAGAGLECRAGLYEGAER